MVRGGPDGISVSMVVVVESGAVTGGPVTLSSGDIDKKLHALQDRRQFSNIQSGFLVHSLLPAQNSHRSSLSSQRSMAPVVMMTTADGGVAGGSVAVVTTCSGIGVADCCTLVDDTKTCGIKVICSNNFSPVIYSLKQHQFSTTPKI